MKLLEVMRGSGRYLMLQGRAKRYFNKLATGTISMKDLLASGVEDGAQMGMPKCNDVNS